jgi:hypothetical protein
MQVWHDEINYDFSDSITNRTFTEQCVFFDIETTGFSSARNTVYLIGCAARKGSTLVIDQFFAETPAQEAEVITAFFSYLTSFTTILSFNGIGFDIPFLKGRCMHFGIPHPFDDFILFDLYKQAASIKSVLQLPNIKQKTIEHFLGIDREDLYDGGQLIAVYQEYIRHPSQEARKLLWQHNYEDVLGMPQLLPLLSYCHVLEGDFTVTALTANQYRAFDGSPKKELYLTIRNNYSLPVPVSVSHNEFHLRMEQEECRLCIRLYEGELKYFLPEPKKYVYLPSEDMAVPKELAASIPANQKERATAANCYTKKNAIFLPQYTPVFEPAFRQSSKDKHSYFLLSEEFISDALKQKQYAKHIFSVLHTAKKIK